MRRAVYKQDHKKVWQGHGSSQDNRELGSRLQLLVEAIRQQFLADYEVVLERNRQGGTVRTSSTRIVLV